MFQPRRIIPASFTTGQQKILNVACNFSRSFTITRFFGRRFKKIYDLRSIIDSVCVCGFMFDCMLVTEIRNGRVWPNTLNSSVVVKN